MAISILRLSSSFPEIFGMSSAFTFENIVQMLQIHDTLNYGCYKTVTEKDFENFETKEKKEENKEDEYQLYCRRNGSDGKSVWEALEDAESSISSSTEIYFKKRGATGKDDSDYVQIYSLIQLDSGKFNEVKSFKHDPASYVASLLYATCCMHKKMMELYMADIEAINDEQKEMNDIMNLLKQMQEDLAALDAGVTDETKHNKAPLEEVVLKFFLTRGLLDTNATQGVLTKDVVEELKAIYLHGQKRINYVQQFQQWSTLASLMSYASGGTMDALDDPTVVSGPPASAITDPYAPCYWRRPAAVSDNPYPPVAALKDQWIFSPYVRDANDNFFDNYNKAHSDLNYRYRQMLHGTDTELSKHLGGEKTDGLKDDSPNYVLRWYGKDPPKNPTEFWKGIADLFRRNDFLPNIQYPSLKSDGSFVARSVYGEDGSFNREFVKELFLGRGKGTNIPGFNSPGAHMVAILDRDCTQIKRLLNTYGAADLSHAQGGDGPQKGEIAVALGKTYLASYPISIQDRTLFQAHRGYWPVPGDEVDSVTGLVKLKHFANAWDGLMEKDLTIPPSVENLELNSDQVTTWTDTLRIYCDRISNESSSQSSQMNTELQYSQQFLNTATQLLAKLNRMMTDIASHIH